MGDTSTASKSGRKVIFGLGGVVVIAIVVLVILFRPTGGTAVDKTEAVENFRKSASSTTSKGQLKDRSTNSAVDDAADGPEMTAPAPGVYTFKTTGQEEVKLGPLPAETRQFPAEVAASVMVPAAKDGDGSSGGSCFDFQLNLIAEHVETTRYCLQGDDLRIDRHDKTIKIGPMTATASMSCDPQVVLGPAKNVDGRACKLKLSGGPITVDADLVGSTTAGDVTKVEVEGSEVDALPVTISYVASGSVSGTWNERYWVSTTDWLPLRIERDIDLSGPANIHENSKLDLTSLKPEV